MAKLGTIDELPKDYVDALETQSTVPLWPFLRGFLPLNKPEPQTHPFKWDYQKLRPLLLEAGELTPIEKAERRVLVLCNPGFPAEDAKITSTLYAGIQLVKPGEVAPNHRHSPSAIRMVIEGDGGFTSVEGIKQPMYPGDLVLTPAGMWHEHGHVGVEPIIWLDILDLPLIYGMGASYSEEGAPQHFQKRVDASDSEFSEAGTVPYETLDTSHNDYPLIRFPWKKARAALDSLSQTTEFGTPTRVAYVNPTTGRECLPVIGLSALLVRPGETVNMPISSCSCVYKTIVGDGQIDIDNNLFRYQQHDVFSVPNFASVRLTNTSTEYNSYFFIADDAPLQRKIGIFETR